MRRGNSGWAVVAGVALGAFAGVALLWVFRPSPNAGRPPPPPPPAAVPVTQPAAEPPEIPELQAILDQAALSSGGTLRVHVRIPGVGQAGIGATEAVPAGALIHLLLLGAVENAWHTGFLTRTRLDETRLREVVTEGDRAAADALLDRIGLSQVNEWLHAVGCQDSALTHRWRDTSPEPNSVAAADLTLLLQGMEARTLVNAGASDEMARLLAGGSPRSIRRAISDGAVLGMGARLRGAVMEAALVRPAAGRPYALAVFVTEQDAPRSAAAGVTAVAAAVHEYAISLR